MTRFLESWFGIVNAHHYFFLALLGIITAAVCFATDLCTVYLIDCKAGFVCYRCFIVKLRTAWNDNYEYHLRYVIYVLTVIVLMVVSVSMSIFVSREVEGSGIPEIKAIIAGIQIPKYLNLNTGIAKIAGLMAALVAGLPVGREGPFIHMSACIA